VRNRGVPDEHMPPACPSQQLSEFHVRNPAADLRLHVSGKLSETTGWQPVLLRNCKFRFSKIVAICVICGNFGCNEAKI